MNTLFGKMLLPVFSILIVSVTYCAPVDALQILAIENVSGKSHWNFMSAVLRSLTDVGHNVTVFTPFPDGDQVNYTEVDVSKDLPMKVAMDAKEIFMTFSKHTVMIPFIMNMTRYYCDIIYEQRDMREILNGGKSNYDIIITEIVASECASYVAAKLNLPLIYVIPSPMVTYIEHSIFGHVPNPATVSHLLADHAIPKTFAQRFLNVVLYGYSAFTVKYNEITLKQFDSKPFDLVEPLKPSLVFMNTHYITEAPRPMPTNVVQIGGIHLKKPGGIPNICFWDGFNFLFRNRDGFSVRSNNSMITKQ